MNKNSAEFRSLDGPAIDDRAIVRANETAAKLGSDALLAAILRYYANRKKKS